MVPAHRLHPAALPPARPLAAGLLAAGILAAGCGPSAGPEGPPGPRPDVLLLVVDTLRADRLGCYGYPRGTSPNLDRLAQRGVVFTRASAQAPWTLPSMTSMMTGRYLTAHRDVPDPGAATLAEVFQQAGYGTVAVVANSLLAADAGFGRGFDEYVLRSAEGGRREPGGFDSVIEWIEEPLARALEPQPDGRRRPLFLYVHAVDPHAPYRRVERYEQDLPVSGSPPIQPQGWQAENLRRLGPPPPEDDAGWKKALRQIRNQRGAYDHDVRFFDEHLARLMQRLEELGVGDDLLIALVADHGEGLWEQVAPLNEERLAHSPPAEFFFQGHGYDLSEQALRTPFVLVGPGVPEGRTLDAPVENVDLFPTLLSLCGLPRPGDLHGLDLVPLMAGEPVEWRTESYSFIYHAITVRDEERGLKLVLPTKLGLERGVGRPLLFDLTADPLERENLYESRKKDARRLCARAMAFLERYPTSEAKLGERMTEDQRDIFRALGYGGDLAGEEDDGGER